jgi:hypothetical protein
VRSSADSVAALFYDRLFEMDPSLRRLFHSDMRERNVSLSSSNAPEAIGVSHFFPAAPRTV